MAPLTAMESVFFETFTEDVRTNTKHRVPDTAFDTEAGADGHLYVVTQRSETRMKPWCQVCLCLSVLFICLGLLAWLTEAPFLYNSGQDTTTDADAVATYDCNVGAAVWKTDWVEAKKEYCCARMHRGCEFNCKLGLAADWSPRKRDFCCQGDECPGADGHPPVPIGDLTGGSATHYDCSGSLQAMHLTQKAWCCDHGTTAACAIHMNMPYNCEDGYRSWKENWSDHKKQWCCDQLGVACEHHHIAASQMHGQAHHTVVHHVVVPTPHAAHQHMGAVTVPVPSTQHHYYDYQHFEAPQVYRPFHCYQGTSTWMTTWSSDKKDYCCKHHPVFCLPDQHVEHHIVHQVHSMGHALKVKHGAGHIPACRSSDNQCPADWKTKSPGGYHCLHKLARQTSESAYQASGGACRPADQGPFPSDDCQDQCYVGVHGSGGSYSGSADSDDFGGSAGSESFGASASAEADSEAGSGVEGIAPCLGSDHKCPADWLSGETGGFHCKHKLARQTSDKAYKESGGACRPAKLGAFPHNDCQDQCSIGKVGSHSKKTSKIYSSFGSDGSYVDGSSGQGSYISGSHWGHRGSYVDGSYTSGSSFGPDATYVDDSFGHGGSYVSGSSLGDGTYVDDSFGHGGSYVSGSSLGHGTYVDGSFGHGGSYVSGSSLGHGDSYISGSSLGHGGSYVDGSYVDGSFGHGGSYISGSSLGDDGSYISGSSLSHGGSYHGGSYHGGSYHGSSYHGGTYGSSFHGGSYASGSSSFSHGSLHSHHGHGGHGGSLGHQVHASIKTKNGIPPCLGTDHRCPAEWLSGASGGFHCKHKLARQTSEKAYEKSGGACRPAKLGAFPHNDCQDQCSIGSV